MKNNFFGEILISVLLISLLIFFINPLNLMMPQVMHPLMIPLLVILFIIFTGILLKEAPGDERDQLHKFIASRLAYFAGALTLVIGIIIQSFNNQIDSWLVITICIMLLAKTVGFLYGYFKK